MNWAWELRPSAARDLRKLDRKVIVAVLDGLDLLVRELREHGRPLQSDTKKLKGKEQEYRLRIGDYRIRFGVSMREIENDRREQAIEGTIVVYRVANRREAY